MSDNALGRPTKFTDVIAAKILELAQMGKTDVQIAEITGIAERTLNYWKTNYPDFLQSLKEAKGLADQMVEASLFKTALGYDHETIEEAINERGEVVQLRKEKHYPPNTTAQIFWLKNRKPENWRDKTEVVNTITEEVTFKIDWEDEYEPSQTALPEKDAAPTEDPETK